MFDDRLFDTIMKEMMSEFGADVRTDEGSLAYNACVKIAEKLEEVYGDMDELNDNLTLATRNLNNVILLEANEINTLDVVSADKLIITETALKNIEEALK